MGVRAEADSSEYSEAMSLGGSRSHRRVLERNCCFPLQEGLQISTASGYAGGR